MQAGHGGLTDGIEVADAGAPVGVHQDAPATVVRGGHNWDGHGTHVDAQLQTTPVDVGETLDQELRRQVGHVEQD